MLSGFATYTAVVPIQEVGHHGEDGGAVWALVGRLAGELLDVEVHDHREPDLWRGAADGTDDTDAGDGRPVVTGDGIQFILPR